MSEGLVIAFQDMSDAELACLYNALGRLVGSVAREAIPPGSEQAFGGPLSAVLAFIDEPKLQALFELGHEAHREVERRGRRRITHFVPDIQWPFASLGAFTYALKLTLPAAA